MTAKGPEPLYVQRLRAFVVPKSFQHACLNAVLQVKDLFLDPFHNSEKFAVRSAAGIVQSPVLPVGTGQGRTLDITPHRDHNVHGLSLIHIFRSVVELLSERYGSKIRTPAETLYTFPTASQLKDVHLEDYIACKAGYRAPYLCDAVRQVLSGSLDLEGIASLSDEALITALEGVKGVGVKVANCVALFAYGRTACAPVDTWIKKIIRQEYQGQNPFDRYGDSAGIMQQYFFYYAQNHKAETA